MGNQWKVLDDRADADDQTAPFWQVQELYEDEWINHYGDYDPDDWCSALAYADRQARTISVTLPRFQDHWPDEPMVIEDLGNARIIVPDVLLEETALALLALHQQRKATQ